MSQEDSQSSSNSQIVAKFTSEWIFAVTWAASLEEIYESEVEILLDSGACDHVCSPEFANHSPLLPRLDTGAVRNADGSDIPTHGRRRVRFRLEDGQIASVEFQVMNVKRCIFNITRLIEQGFRMDFERQVVTGPDGRQAQIHRHGRLYTQWAQMDVQTAKGVREPRQPTEKERSEHSLTHVVFEAGAKPVSWHVQRKIAIDQ